VKGRLQRGRELLRARLRRRGLELPASLFVTTLALNSASAQVSSPLAAMTLRAAVKVAAGQGVVASGVPAAVAALVQGASTTMLNGKAKLATVLLVTTSLLAVALGLVRHRATAGDQPSPAQKQTEKSRAPVDRPPPAAKPKSETEGTIEASGKVVDPDGKPVAGAKLYLAKPTLNGPVPSQQATSGPDGRFRFAVPQSAPPKGAAEESAFQVMAIAKGYGCDWVKIGPAREELTLRLVKDVPIRGRILDPDGRPVKGAKLTVMGLSTFKGDDLGKYLETVRKRDFRNVFAKGWAGALPGQPAGLTTGADGRFKLSGAGRERVIHFRVEGPAIATLSLAVMTRAAETVADADGRRIYGASFEYVAVASRPIRGVVRDKDTGKPLAGVTVMPLHLSQMPLQQILFKAVTDKKGRYELLGLARSPRYLLELKPADGLYFQRWAELQDTPGFNALTGDLDIVQGEVTVRGKVTDKAGKPIARARVDYHPLFANPNVNKKLDGAWLPRSETVTGPDGSYVLTVMPGAGVIGVAGPEPDAYMPALVTLKERKDFFKVPLAQDVSEEFLSRATGNNGFGVIGQASYHALVLLEPDEKGTLVRNVTLEPAKTLKGRVVDPDGRPLAGVKVFGLSQFAEETLKGTEFTVRGFNLRVKRQLVFYHKDKNLGFFMKELRGATEPLTIKLQPCGSVSGRMVDQDGQPVAGFRIHLVSRVWSGFHQVTTDKEGHFRVEGLVPGQEYSVSPYNKLSRLFARVPIEPGKHKDLGDVKIQPDN
jgi:protocatechuate 3,4-dioxygenase beta subunit